MSNHRWCTPVIVRASSHIQHKCHNPPYQSRNHVCCWSHSGDLVNVTKLIRQLGSPKRVFLQHLFLINANKLRLHALKQKAA